MSVRKDHQLSVPPGEYLERILDVARRSAISDTLSLPLQESFGHVLAQDVFAGTDIPSFANSAMDGFAVLGSDLRGEDVTLQVVGDQPAGSARALSIQAGQAVRIMTGAPLPKGADTVVQSEITEDHGSAVTVASSARPCANVRMPGEDVQAGKKVLSRGMRLSAQRISAAAACGESNLLVYQVPKVGVISTGDELAEPGQTLKEGPPLKLGQIFESNSYMLAALVEKFGANARRYRASSDLSEDLAGALDKAALENDVILLSGGVSVGKYDVVRNLLDGSSGAWFTRVAIQPGKPQGIAEWKNTPVLAFPGNPVGSFVSFYLFGKPFIKTIAREVLSPTLYVPARAGADWKCPKDRRQYTPVSIEMEENGSLIATPTNAGGSGSHLVTSLASAQALAVVEPGKDKVQMGQAVKVMWI